MSVLVGRKAPDFCVKAVLGNGKTMDEFKLSEAIKGKYGLVFFYPYDFTFVCPTELIAVDKRMNEFQKRNVEVVGVSIDSHHTHNAWRNTAVNKGGIGPVNYVLAADVHRSICQSYGVEHPEDGMALRAAFIIDKNGVVRSQVVNDLPLGRNVDELLRTIDALQYHEKHGEVCPAGWKQGDVAMHETPESVAAYLSSNAENL